MTNNTHTLDSNKTEEEKIFGWRLKQFESLGLAPVEAATAALTKIDYHEMQKLIDAGCNPTTALLVLKPF